jgi:hypothetical protein
VERHFKEDDSDLSQQSCQSCIIIIDSALYKGRFTDRNRRTIFPNYIFHINLLGRRAGNPSGKKSQSSTKGITIFVAGQMRSAYIKCTSRNNTRDSRGRFLWRRRITQPDRCNHTDRRAGNTLVYLETRCRSPLNYRSRIYSSERRGQGCSLDTAADDGTLGNNNTNNTNRQRGSRQIDKNQCIPSEDPSHRTPLPLYQRRDRKRVPEGSRDSRENEPSRSPDQNITWADPQCMEGSDWSQEPGIDDERWWDWLDEFMGSTKLELRHAQVYPNKVNSG